MSETNTVGLLGTLIERMKKEGAGRDYHGVPWVDQPSVAQAIRSPCLHHRRRNHNRVNNSAIKSSSRLIT